MASRQGTRVFTDTSGIRRRIPDPSGLIDRWYWWYYNEGGRTPNLHNQAGYRELFSVLEESEQVQTAKREIAEEAIRLTLHDATTPFAVPHSRGQRTFSEPNPLRRNLEFAGNELETAISHDIELSLGNVRIIGGLLGDDSNHVDLDATRPTTLYALGGSGRRGGVRGTGTLRWSTSGCASLPSGELSVAVTLPGRCNFEFRDRFVDARDVLDRTEGNQEWIGGITYDIVAQLRSQQVRHNSFEANVRSFRFGN